MLTRSMIDRVTTAATFDEAVGIALDDLIALVGAVYGNVQLVCEGELVIVAQRGFAKHFLTAFRTVRISDGLTVCARAARAHKQIVLSDVRADADYASLRVIADEAGYRAVQSTPLITSGGVFVGVLSTHFRNVHTPTEIEMQALKDYSIAAADHLYSLLGGTSLCAKAEEMNASLCGAGPAPSRDFP